MFKTKVYKYDSSQESNGYRGEDFSKYVLQGAEITEDLSQELDTAEITLSGLNFNKEFDAETKFIIDIVEDDGENQETILETHHFCVSRDTVNQPILSDENYFDHHISFIEPSVIAQKRLVDNISVTYKLKDVTLQETPFFPDTQSNISFVSSRYTPPSNFGKTYEKSGIITQVENETIIVGKYFEPEGTLYVINRNGEKIRDTYNNIEKFASNGGYYAKFEIPKLAIYWGVDGTKDYSKIGYASLDYSIQEFTLNDETNPTNVWSGSFISNSNLGTGTASSAYSGKNTKINGEWLLEQVGKTKEVVTTAQRTEMPIWYFKKYTETSASTPTYITQEIPMRVDRKYIIYISLHQFPDNVPSEDKYTGSQPSYYVKHRSEGNYSALSGYLTIFQYPENLFMTANQTSSSAFFITYDIATGEIVYASSTPYSALTLLQKAIINSSIYEKSNGVYIADINNSNIPFYIDDNFIDQLSATTIIENFYNQKNLWEIMIEVGHYIHSIPELKFGKDDKFLITFNPLGRTDEKTDNSTKVSIYNSRNVEDYISATSSYITNMVQLGGLIEEWVSPKTTNEQLLVSNDTAEIIVSKPIIELLSIVAKNNTNGQTKDITQYIYEENVYKTLQIDEQVNPNRGIAMYYQLGNNVITGGQYQLPQANTNIFSDYSFKKILYIAFNGSPSVTPIPTTGYWTDLKVSDYSFFVRYRTKDSVRQSHIRPDLRKYLLNSKYDKIPEHNQFNNQTDVVVDSIKFGNNMYGKLIKTGNSSYDKVDWIDNYSNIKHKGELYRINAELYYISKITHYYFGSYILSKTKYSKDYNELSAVIGIPSEPRFYEISEQSLIKRDLAINDVLLLTDDQSKIQPNSNFVFTYDHLAGLILESGVDFAKYAITVFKGDKDIRSFDRAGGQENSYKEVLNAVNAYSSENTLTYEWDMVDNYSAGDKIVDITPNVDLNVNEKAYSSLRAVSYTDIYGKAPLLDFYILGDIGNLTTQQIKALPESPISTKQNDSRPFVGTKNILATNVNVLDTNYNGRGLGLIKDCREALSMNFNLQLATTSDTFVLSPYIFSPNKKNLKIVLLAEEVNKLSSGYIDNSLIITPLDNNGNTMSPYFNFNVSRTNSPNKWGTASAVTSFGINLSTILSNVNENHFNGTEGYQRVKSIAILCDVSLNTGIEDTNVSVLPYKTQFVIARNIPNFWDKEEATKSIYFGSPNKNNVFKNKQ